MRLSFDSGVEIDLFFNIGILFIFTVLAFSFNLGTTLKIFESFDGNDWPIKHAIRPLIPMVVILIRYLCLLDH